MKKLLNSKKFTLFILISLIFTFVLFALPLVKYIYPYENGNIRQLSYIGLFINTSVPLLTLISFFIFIVLYIYNSLVFTNIIKKESKFLSNLISFIIFIVLFIACLIVSII